MVTQASKDFKFKSQSLHSIVFRPPTPNTLQLRPRGHRRKHRAHDSHKCGSFSVHPLVEEARHGGRNRQPQSKNTNQNHNLLRILCNQMDAERKLPSSLAPALGMMTKLHKRNSEGDTTHSGMYLGPTKFPSQSNRPTHKTSVLPVPCTIDPLQEHTIPRLDGNHNRACCVQTRPVLINRILVAPAPHIHTAPRTSASCGSPSPVLV